MTEEKRTYKKSKIMCMETGEVFDNAKAAADSIGVKNPAMSNHLAGRCKTLKGKTFIRI